MDIGTQEYIAEDTPPSVTSLDSRPMHEIPEFLRLYQAYYEGYADPTATMKSHLERAKALALPLLYRYYPEEQGFVVAPEPFDQMSKFDYSIELHQSKIPKPKPVGKKKGGGKKSKKDMEEDAVVVEDTSARLLQLYEQHQTCPIDFHKAYGTWHCIPCECIAGFVVYKTYTVPTPDGPEAEKLFPHTYLAIMIDDLQTMQLWDSYNSHAPRADVMAYSLGVHGKIDKGYGILIIGPRIEFYRYDNTAFKPTSHFSKDNWGFDLSEDNPAIVNQIFEAVASTTVQYQNGELGYGASRQGLPDDA